MGARIYLFEFMVNKITLDRSFHPDATRQDIQVNIRFAEILNIDIDTENFPAKGDPTEVVGETLDFDMGKSYLFIHNYKMLIQEMKKRPMEIGFRIRRKLEGKGQVKFKSEFHEMVNLYEQIGVVKAVDFSGDVALEGADGKIGSLQFYVRMSCHGEAINSQFQVTTSDGKREYLFKNPTSTNVFVVQLYRESEGGILPVASLYNPVTSNPAGFTALSEGATHISMTELFGDTNKLCPYVSNIERPSTIIEVKNRPSFMQSEVQDSPSGFDIVSMCFRPPENKFFDLLNMMSAEVNTRTEGTIVTLTMDRRGTQNKENDIIVEEDNPLELTADKINRKLCKNKDCPAAKLFKEYGMGPLATGKGLGTIYGDVEPPCSYGLSHTYGTMDNYGPYGVFTRPKRLDEPFVPPKSALETPMPPCPNRQEPACSRAKGKAREKSSENRCLRIRGGGMLDQEVTRKKEEVGYRFHNFQKKAEKTSDKAGIRFLSTSTSTGRAAVLNKDECYMKGRSSVILKLEKKEDRQRPTRYRNLMKVKSTVDQSKGCGDDCLRLRGGGPRGPVRPKTPRPKSPTLQRTRQTIDNDSCENHYRLRGSGPSAREILQCSNFNPERFSSETSRPPSKVTGAAVGGCRSKLPTLGGAQYKVHPQSSEGGTRAGRGHVDWPPRPESAKAGCAGETDIQECRRSRTEDGQSLRSVRFNGDVKEIITETKEDNPCLRLKGGGDPMDLDDLLPVSIFKARQHRSTRLKKNSGFITSHGGPMGIHDQNYSDALSDQQQLENLIVLNELNEKLEHITKSNGNQEFHQKCRAKFANHYLHRLRGGGSLSVENTQGPKSPMQECKSVMDQLDGILAAYKKALGPCGEATCPYAANLAEEGCRKQCEKPKVPDDAECLSCGSAGTCDVPACPYRENTRTFPAGCGSPKCAYTKYKLGLVDDDAALELAFLPPAVSGKCGHPKCPYPLEPPLPPIHWDCPDPLPKGNCKNPNCPLQPPNLRKIICPPRKGPCGSPLCPYALPPPCELPTCPFRENPCPFLEKQKKNSAKQARKCCQPVSVPSDEICENPDCPFAPKTSDDAVTRDPKYKGQFLVCANPECPFAARSKPKAKGRCGDPNCPFPQKEQQKKECPFDKKKKNDECNPRCSGGIKGSNQGNKHANICENPDCPFAAKNGDDFCGNPHCPFAPKEDQDGDDFCGNPACPFAPKKEDNFCGNPDCPFAPKKEEDFCGNPDCPFAPKKEEDFCGNPECPFAPKKEDDFCGNPECPFAPKKEDDFCGNPNCPFAHNTKKDFCGNPDCPFAPKKEEFCGNPECPFAPRKEEGVCDNPDCPFAPKKEDVCENPDCPFAPKKEDVCDNPNCPFAPKKKEVCDNPDCPFASPKKVSICDDPYCPYLQPLPSCGIPNCPYEPTPIICPPRPPCPPPKPFCPSATCPGKSNNLKNRSSNRTYEVEESCGKDDGGFSGELGDDMLCDNPDCAAKKAFRANDIQMGISEIEKQSLGDIMPSQKGENRQGAKRKKRGKFVYTMGDKYPGVKVGHKECITPTYNVPPKMGWLWNVHTPVLRLKPRRGWKPGAIEKTIAKRIKAHRKAKGLGINQVPSFSKRKGMNSDSDDNSVAPKPTLHITKKEGAYLITMNPLKDPKTLADRENPYMDCTPMQFKITKNKKKKREDGNDESRLCFCDDDDEQSSSSESELDIEFTPPAGIIHPERFKKKRNVVHTDTQYNPQDFATKSKDKGKDKKGKKGGKEKGGKGEGKKGKGGKGKKK